MDATRLGVNFKIGENVIGKMNWTRLPKRTDIVMSAELSIPTTPFVQE